jgi:hypothetical protein
VVCGEKTTTLEGVHHSLAKFVDESLHSTPSRIRAASARPLIPLDWFERPTQLGPVCGSCLKQHEMTTFGVCKAFTTSEGRTTTPKKVSLRNSKSIYVFVRVAVMLPLCMCVILSDT